MLARVHLRVSLPIIAAQGAVDSPQRLVAIRVSRGQRRYSLLLEERKRSVETAIGKRHVHALVRRLQDVGRPVVTVHAVHGADLASRRRGRVLRLRGVHVGLAGPGVHGPHPRDVLPFGIGRDIFHLARHMPVNSHLRWASGRAPADPHQHVDLPAGVVLVG